jgi:hypothetical protein
MYPLLEAVDVVDGLKAISYVNYNWNGIDLLAREFPRLKTLLLDDAYTYFRHTSIDTVTLSSSRYWSKDDIFGIVYTLSHDLMTSPFL